MRWPEGPPHLALNPPSFFFLFFGCFFCFCFFWRVKGQVRWPKGPPYLALNPPYLFLLLFCFVFCFFVLFFGCLIQKTLFFPRKGHFLFSVFLFLSLAFFGLPLFCVSLSLSLFFLLLFLSSCLSGFFAVFWFLVLVSFFIFLSFLLFFHERNNIKKINCKFFSSSIFSLFLVSCLFSFKFLFLIFAISSV